eukprot:10060412-Lingulodinium_polyedra.AAC.1
MPVAEGGAYHASRSKNTARAATVRIHRASLAAAEPWRIVKNLAAEPQLHWIGDRTTHDADKLRNM